VCRAFGEPLVIEEVAIEAPQGPGEILVDVHACAICHSDITFIEGGWGGDLPALLCRMAQRVGVPGPGRWRSLLDTAAPRVVGAHDGISADRLVDLDAEAMPWQHQPASVIVDIQALSIVVLGRPGE
jgi:hypothetical protein